MKVYFNNNLKFFVITDDDYTPENYEFEVDEKDYNEYLDKRDYFYDVDISIIDNKVVFNYEYNQIEYNKNKVNELRQKREPLLKAFDIYKSNVNYGVIEETNEEHSEIITWYKSLLDLDEEALNNVPNSIQKYLQV